MKNQTPIHSPTASFTAQLKTSEGLPKCIPLHPKSMPIHHGQVHQQRQHEHALKFLERVNQIE